MSVWLTPARQPFYGGTYFPPDNRYGRPGFRTVLENLARAWKGQRARIEQSGAQLLERLRASVEDDRGGLAAILQPDLDSAFFAFRRSFDSRWGGFSDAPKFPRPAVHHFLLRYWERTGNAEALEMVLQTLREMARGGMRDQIGGGFHRYSVDQRWFVPHFEKMLYDQAQLAVSYLDAFQITRDPQYAAVATDIFEYVLRDLTHPEGGFYSAEDADSAPDASRPREKQEGAFYLWSHQELMAALGPQDGAVFCRRYGVEPHGNVQHDPHGEFSGRNILHQADPADPDQQALLDRAVLKLRALRASRPRPHLDDKVLAAWNGLMIGAFARGAQVLEEPRYLEAARGAARFIRARLWRHSTGALLRRFREGESSIEGFLDDYAFLANGLIDLYEAAFDPPDLAWAALLAGTALELFEDREAGGFFSTPAGQSDLVLRLKDDYDGAEPSSNSAMILALLRLASIMDNARFRDAAGRALGAFASRMRDAGPALPLMLSAQMLAMSGFRQIVLAGPPQQCAGLLRVLRRRFLPDAVVLRASEAPDPMPAVEGRPTAYVCRNFACQLPATSAQALEDSLSQPVQ
jgi:uncharacterized protein YyaL (SSP411 family)